MDKNANRESITPTRLLRLFESKLCDENKVHAKNGSHPTLELLPGEEIVFSQSNVTCVATLPNIAKGVLHLTNYRFIFSGSPTQESEGDTSGHGSQFETIRQGYRYQKKKYQMPKVNHGLQKIHKYIGQSVRKTGRALHSSLKRKREHIFFNRYNLEEEEDNFEVELPQKDIDLLRVRLGSRMNLDSGEEEAAMNGCLFSILISLPIMSVAEIRKYPKQYLEKEKLKLLRDGIEIICNNLTSVRFCIGDSDLYNIEELIYELERNCKIENINSAFVYSYSIGLCIPRSCNGILQDRSAPNFYRFADEIQRLKLNEMRQLSVVAQTVCSRYPRDVIISSRVGGKKELLQLADYHTNRCFPVATWRSSKTGCVLFRSGMPKMPRGFSDSRCEVDENFLHEHFPLTTNQNAKIMIFTERFSSTSNYSGGLSIAEGQAYYYPRCSFLVDDHMSDLEDIQQSGIKLMNALADKTDDSRYLSAIEDSGWLEQIRKLLETSFSVASSIENDQTSVVVAYGQGVDRTAQIVSLAQLLLDPYYRTLDGFQVLIQKEWLFFRHPFIQRNISRLSNEENISPIFLQFLDCVWQLYHQFPTLFQFSDHLLEELAVHAYSGRFGTFLDMNDYEQDEVLPFWTWLNIVCMAQDNLTNANYDENENTGLLYPVTAAPWLKVWKWHYRYKAEESLVLARDIETVQLENLQRTYQEKLDEYRSLLHTLSEVDAGNASRFNFHIRSAGGPSSQIADQATYNRSQTIVDGRKAKGLLSSLFGKKSRSFDDLLSIKASNNSKAGRSIFYEQDEEDGRDAAISPQKTFPRSARLVSSRCNLRTELNNNGIRFFGINEVILTEKTCSGYLVKQGKVRKSWKRRWFVLDLQKGCVAYFQNHLSDQPKGVFKCLAVTNVYEHHNQEKYPNSFIIETTDRTFSIEAPNSNAMHVWLGCFQVILKS
eukprot:gene19870-21812_t